MDCLKLNQPKPSGWTHYVMNYIGPNEGEGSRLHLNGAEVGSDTTKAAASPSAGNGRIVVGRLYTNSDEHYANVQVDELIFFNQTLSPSDIDAIIH